MQSNTIEWLDLETQIIIWGQEDYVARVESYLAKLIPSAKLIRLAAPLTYDQPDRTIFDFRAMLKKLDALDRNACLIEAFSAKYKNILQDKLKKFSFRKVLHYDAELDNKLKKKFFKILFHEQGKNFIILDEMPDEHPPISQEMKVYMARHIADKALKSFPSRLSKYIFPIQAGAALTNERIATLTDAEGDNISDRNSRYSEITVFYWMWKHAHADWLGICHYRRLFVNLDDIASKLEKVDVDALLPLPTLCQHSVYEDYLLKHIPNVWKPMMCVLKDKSPEYYKAAQDIFRGKVFYASNMCILRREVLNELCEWMFPIVMETECMVGELPDAYFNRYAGFCTERLITLYFIFNSDKLRIAHIEKEFIS